MATGGLIKAMAQKYIEESREEGIEKGREEGVEKGREEGITNTIINMLKQNFDINLISQVTGFTVEQIHMLKYSLKTTIT